MIKSKLSAVCAMTFICQVANAEQINDCENAIASFSPREAFSICEGLAEEGDVSSQLYEVVLLFRTGLRLG